MKTYIAPSINVVNLNTEDTLLATSFAANNVKSNSSMLSNKRESASNTIWGYDDEAE